MIDIVIPNWNGKDLLKTCLDSLDNQSCKCFRVTVVDNGSTDGSVPFITKHYPAVRVIELPENKGFSVAVNRGILAADKEWVLLLNNDVEVDNLCLEQLKKNCSRSPGFDYYSLKMNDFYNRTYLDGAGDVVMRGGVGYRLGTMEEESERYRVRREIFGACAGAALYKRSLFDEIGLFDEDFFAYLEDVDLNLRAVRAGKRCCYLPDAIIYHMGSASSGSKINHFTVRLTTRNNVFVVLKNFGPLLLLRFLLPFLIYQCFWFLFVVKNRQFIPYVTGLVESLRYLFPMCKRYQSAKNSAVLSLKQFGDRIVESEEQAILSIVNRRNQQGKKSRLFDIYLRFFC